MAWAFPSADGGDQYAQARPSGKRGMPPATEAPLPAAIDTLPLRPDHPAQPMAMDRRAHALIDQAKTD